MSKKDNILAIGCDHAGYQLKEFLKEKLCEDNYEIKDFGAYSEESVDYPDIIHPLAKLINEKEIERGIIICGSGNGASITANKYINVRSALCWSVEQAELSRLHNEANILSLPARFIDLELAYNIVTKFLLTEFEGGRHKRRVDKISLL